MSISEETPPGVELYDLDDHVSARKRIFDGVKKEFLSVFPQSYGGVRLSVDNVDYADPEEYSIADQKDALLKDKFLARRLRGTLTLHDEKTGEKLDSRDMTLMRVPYLTERGTFLHGGNEYASIMQSRLLPGAYTRRQNNGGLECQFNVRSGTGTAFRVGFEPDTSQYRLKVQQANLHLYSLLHDLGVPDSHLAETWGPSILEVNQRKYDPRVFDKAYARFVPKRLQKPDAEHAEKAQAIKEALEAARIHGGAARRTLPNMFDLHKAASWAKQAARMELEAEFVKNSAQAFAPDFTPEELTEVRNAAHGVGPRLAGMAEWPAEWLPEHDPSWHAWWEQYHHGRRTDDDAKQIMRWNRFKRLHGDKLRENPTPRRAFALKAWGIDPLKLVDGRSRSKLEREMATYKSEAAERHEKKAFEDEDLHKLAAVLNNDFRAAIDADSLNLHAEILEFLGSRPDIDAELLYARLGESKAASVEVPEGLWVMEKLARYGAGVLFKQPNGKYLLQENGPDDCDDPEGVGKLRPAGGGKSKRDHNLRATILREMKEEFDIDPDVAADKVELLGYINDGPFEDCAMFVMEDHGLKPGVYQASNSKNEKIKLVEADLDDARYIGKKPEELRPFADSDHPGNKKASEDYECPHCHEAFDYADEPEVGMGAVACPHCKKFVPQEGKPHRVLVRFTRFEIHKLAKMIRPQFKEALEASSVPGDVVFYTSDIQDRCYVCTGDWHSEDVAQAAQALARQYYKHVTCEAEGGRPAWAETSLSSGQPKSSAVQPITNQPPAPTWDFDQGIFDDADAGKIRNFADAIYRSPSPWQPEFKPSQFIDTYANQGHAAMTVKPYGIDVLPWIAQARRAYGFVNPGSPFAWKDKMIRPSDSVLEGINLDSPTAKLFVNRNPDGSLKGIQESALHYLAFQTSPHAAYRQLWNEFDAPTSDRMALLLQKYQQKHPQFNASEFDRFVSRLDPEFHKHKQEVDALIGKDMRPTAQVYADISHKALGWDQALEKPKVPPPTKGTYLPAVAAGAAGLGAAALAYWLWQKHRKKKQQEQEKAASAKQLEAVEARRSAALEDLKKAKEHSDRKEYGQKSVIMTRLFREHPDDFIMDDDWDYAGITHVPSGFRIHVPRNTVPAEIATSPLTQVWQRKKSEEFKRMDLGGADLLSDMAKPKAVLITGNPEFINTDEADKFYQQVEQHLQGLGYDVSRDPGAPHTVPEAADLWVGHSRGAERLQYAPPGVKTIAIGAEGGLNHPDDAAFRGGVKPTAAHFQLSEDMKSKLTEMAKHASDSKSWIGVDLDSTLAFRPHMIKGIPFIGKPVAAMKKRVMAWINGGQKVKIFTARASSPGAIPPVKAWLKEHGFPPLEVTNVKDQFCVAIYDDRAIGVEPNTGRLLSPAHDE